MADLRSERSGFRLSAAIDLGSCGCALIQERDERGADIAQGLVEALAVEPEPGVRWPMMRALEKIAEAALESGCSLLPTAIAHVSWYEGAAVAISPLYTCLRAG